MFALLMEMEIPGSTQSISIRIIKRGCLDPTEPLSLPQTSMEY